jgi:hypothetical protein
MNSYKHSGTAGDLLYSLPIVKHTGGGKFYLHLDQINWMGKHYYGATIPQIHQSRMNLGDYEFLKPLMEAQSYISSFEVLDPKQTEITHNLDNFRVPFVGNPGNYVDIYAETFGFRDSEVKRSLRQTPWLTVDQPRSIPDRDIVVNRTTRWLPPTLSPIWDDWREQGLEERSIFVGLPDEHVAFESATGWKIPYQKTSNALEIAELIAGASNFIGNQSMALSIAIGLGVPFWCEARRDLPIERNECYFPEQPDGNYF